MDYAQTSLQAYFSIQRDGTTGKQRMLILRCLRANQGGMTRAELSHVLGLRLSSVCGRVKELQNFQLVAVRGVKYDPSSGRAHERLVAL